MSNYDSYVYAIAVLLPISASMLIVQTNPYNALVMRGILGAISALFYTILGAADVALTEALVGAFLATMLYAVAVRSSLVLRLGVLEEIAIAHDLEEELDKITPSIKGAASEPFEKVQVRENDYHYLDFNKLIDTLKSAFSKHYMRVELVGYSNLQAVEQALIDRDVHAILKETVAENAERQYYQIKIRLNRIYQIMQADSILGNSQLANVKLVYQK